MTRSRFFLAQLKGWLLVAVLFAALVAAALYGAFCTWLVWREIFE